jgi:streptomycin 6-kinase
VTRRIDVPEAVRQKAVALGAAGEQWLRELPEIVDGIAHDWQLEIGEPLAGGTGAFVAPATTADGEAAILKVAIPDGLDGHPPFAEEIHGLELGAGRGFVRMIRVDFARRAMLQERLGRPLGSLGLPVEEQIDVIVDALRPVWQPVSDPGDLRTGFEQAEFLEMFVLNRWNELGRPCPADTIRRACEFAHARRDAFDEHRAALVHGDAHPGNILEAPNGGYRLIDPSVMRSEPEHDLAIPLRDWTNDLIVTDDPTAQGRAWCARLAEGAGVDARALWEWAFLERVSTGLYLMSLGDRRYGGCMLAVADEWATTPAS